MLEGFEEHHVADVIVKELENVSPGDEQWAAKFKVLKENIEHHIEEEEGRCSVRHVASSAGKNCARWARGCRNSNRTLRA